MLFTLTNFNIVDIIDYFFFDVFSIFLALPETSFDSTKSAACSGHILGSTQSPCLHPCLQQEGHFGIDAESFK